MAVASPKVEGVLDIKQIMKILPHRYPFLLVDKIIEMDVENNVIVGQKMITMNEQFFQGHFPGAPIMPGVLIVEALAQTGAVFAYYKGEPDKYRVLLTIKEAKFRHPVRPGDVLTLRCQGRHFSSTGGRVSAQALVGDKIVVEAELGFAFLDVSQV